MSGNPDAGTPDGGASSIADDYQRAADSWKRTAANYEEARKNYAAANRTWLEAAATSRQATETWHLTSVLIVVAAIVTAVGIDSARRH